MNRTMSRAGQFMAMLLVGIGIALFVRTMVEVGTDRFAMGHVAGPALVAAGIVRLRLQRMLDEQARSDAPTRRDTPTRSDAPSGSDFGGDDGAAS